jgi:hypothetical protein
MASSAQSIDLVFKAAGDLSGKQYYCMKISAARTVDVCSAATDVPAGVLQNKPAAANRAAVIRTHGSTKISANASLTAGNLIGTSSDGQADAKTVGTDTTEYVLGIVVDSPGAAGDIVEAIISVPPFRAA